MRGRQSLKIKLVQIYPEMFRFFKYKVTIPSSLPWQRNSCHLTLAVNCFGVARSVSLWGLIMKLQSMILAVH